MAHEKKRKEEMRRRDEEVAAAVAALRARPSRDAVVAAVERVLVPEFQDVQRKSLIYCKSRFGSTPKDLELKQRRVDTAHSCMAELFAQMTSVPQYQGPEMCYGVETYHKNAAKTAWRHMWALAQQRTLGDEMPCVFAKWAIELAETKRGLDLVVAFTQRQLESQEVLRGPLDDWAEHMDTVYVTRGVGADKREFAVPALRVCSIVFDVVELEGRPSSVSMRLEACESMKWWKLSDYYQERLRKAMRAAIRGFGGYTAVMGIPFRVAPDAVPMEPEALGLQARKMDPVALREAFTAAPTKWWLVGNTAKHLAQYLPKLMERMVDEMLNLAARSLRLEGNELVQKGSPGYPEMPDNGFGYRPEATIRTTMLWRHALTVSEYRRINGGFEPLERDFSGKCTPREWLTRYLALTFVELNALPWSKVGRLWHRRFDTRDLLDLGAAKYLPIVRLKLHWAEASKFAVDCANFEGTLAQYELAPLLGFPMIPVYDWGDQAYIHVEVAIGEKCIGEVRGTPPKQGYDDVAPIRKSANLRRIRKVTVLRITAVDAGAYPDPHLPASHLVRGFSVSISDLYAAAPITETLRRRITNVLRPFMSYLEIYCQFINIGLCLEPDVASMFKEEEEEK